MAITRIQESFDTGNPIGSAQIASFGSLSILTTNPRTGARHARAGAPGGLAYSGYNYSGFGTLNEGFIYGAHTIPSGIQSGLCWLGDGSVIHLELAVGADRLARIYLGNLLGTLIAVGTYAWPGPSLYTQWCLYWKIDDAGSGGAVKLWINGNPTPDINVSSVDTRNGGNNYVTLAQVGAISHTASVPVTCDFDDVMVQDKTGSAPENDYLGDIGVVDVYPNAAGDNSDGTIAGSSPAPTRHESLDEIPADDGVTTVQFATVGHRLLMHYTDLTDVSGSIFAVSPVARWRKLSAASRGWKPEVKLSGTSLVGTERFPSTSWVTEVLDVFHRDPATNAWTGTNVNSTQGGGELTT